MVTTYVLQGLKRTVTWSVIVTPFLVTAYCKVYWSPGLPLNSIVLVVAGTPQKLGAGYVELLAMTVHSAVPPEGIALPIKFTFINPLPVAPHPLYSPSTFI